MRNVRKIIIVAIILFSFTSLAEGQKRELTQYQLDSLDLVAYQKKVVKHLHDSVVLSMCDTFFVKAGKVGNIRWQAVSLAYKVDYWYLLSKEDSLFVAIDRVKEFSKEHNQPIYYYFVWKRKITHFIKSEKFNLALNEMNLLQKDAMDAEYYPAQIDVLVNKAWIFEARSMHQEASDCFEEAISVMESAPEDVEVVNRFYIYNSYSKMCLYLSNFDKMKNALDKSVAYIDNLKGNEGALYIGYYYYYSNIGDLDKANDYLRKAVELDYTSETLNGDLYLLQARKDSAIKANNPRLALSLLDTIVTMSRDEAGLYKDYANILEDLGDYKGANSNLRKLLHFRDSVRLNDMRNDISEMIVLMDVNKVKAENAALEIEMKNRMLTNTFNIIIIISIAFVIAALLLVRYFRINRQLVKTQDNLNHALAKVEEESRVKSDFLNQLSHEVRTPLNSIVGFSEAIVESVGMNKEYSQYCDFISESSIQLIKMVNDAVEVSDYDLSLMKIEADINSCYKTAIEQSTIKPNPAVQLRFDPYIPEGEKGSSLFMIDKSKVVKILANLLHNSSKFTKQGEIVTKVSVDNHTKRIIYTISDTGIGIPPESQDYVFENFAKLDPMSQGLGLGLSLCRLLAKSMNGTITIDPEYTIGCRMIFSFPY